MKKIFNFLMIFVLVFLIAGCENKNEIVFADAGWDSIQFHNAVAGFIAVEAYGYEGWREVRGTTPITHESLVKGDIDVHMEEWTDNIPQYYPDVEAGKIVELGINFDDNYQGLYVPRYMIEGDEERGIEAVAPNLKTVSDLPEYWELFITSQSKNKGFINGAMVGWEVDEILKRKVEHLGLDETFVYHSHSSDGILSAQLANAYEKGEPVLGYYWEPTWLMGKYDFVLLEDEPFTNLEDFQAGKTELPPMDIKIAVSNNFHDKNPEFSEFLSNYYTTSEWISNALAYTQELGGDVDYTVTAKWFLKEYNFLLEEWLPEDKVALVNEALEG